MPQDVFQNSIMSLNSKNIFKLDIKLWLVDCFDQENSILSHCA